MEPVNIGRLTDTMGLVAGGIIPFGGAVVRSAAGKGKAAITANDNDILGIAGMSEVETRNPGFWSTNDAIPVICGLGTRINLLVVANGSVDLVAGDFLEVADMGISPAGTHGVLEECGSTDGGTRLTSAVAKAVEDKTMGADSNQTPSTITIGDETVTFASAANKTSIDLSDGDYVILEDVSDDLQINRVYNVDRSTTIVYLQRPSTVAVTSGDSDIVNKVFQCEAVLI